MESEKNYLNAYRLGLLREFFAWILAAYSLIWVKQVESEKVQILIQVNQQHLELLEQSQRINQKSLDFTTALIKDNELFSKDTVSNDGSIPNK